MTHPPPARREARRTSAALAAALSFIFPGLGQAYAGRSRLALLFAAPTLLLVGMVGGAILLGIDAVLRVLVLPGALAAVIVLDLALMAWRLAAIGNAGLTTSARLPSDQTSPIRRAGGRGLVARAVIVLLMVATIAMHVWAAGVAVSADQALARIFGTPPGSTPAPYSFRYLDPVVPDYRWDGTERINVLLIGYDSGPGRTDELTDTIMVATIDPVTRTAALISIPRDTGYVPLPDRAVYPNGIFPNRINELASEANADPGLWCPDQAAGQDCGVRTLRGTVGLYLGLEIHHVAWVDLLGFAALVNALGGVELCLPGVLADPEYGGPTWEGQGVVLAEGCHVYDGAHALAYARIRKGTLTLHDGSVEVQDDFLRAARQQDLLLAIQREVAESNLLIALPNLLSAVAETVTTDFPRQQAGDLASLAPLIEEGQVERIVLGWPRYVDLPVDPETYYLLIPMRESVRAQMARLLGGAAELVGWYLGSTEPGPPS